jgi:hypothetical protein
MAEDADLRPGLDPDGRSRVGRVEVHLEEAATRRLLGEEHSAPRRPADAVQTAPARILSDHFGLARLPMVAKR